MNNCLFTQNRNANINLDSDGLFSYLFLKKSNSIHGINGFNNSEDLILSTANYNEMWNDVFIDIFTPLKNTITIDQHIIMSDKNRCEYGKEKINPHLLIEQHYANSESYRRKFPLSTSDFLLALLEGYKLIKEPLNLFQEIPKNKYFPRNLLLVDFKLRADGVFMNSIKYEENVKYWYEKMFELSNNGKNTKEIYDYLFSLSKKERNEIHNLISEGYKKYGLREDGGYNRSKTLDENIDLCNGLLRAFGKYLGVELIRKDTSINVYKGIFNTNESNDFRFLKGTIYLLAVAPYFE